MDFYHQVLTALRQGEQYLFTLLEEAKGQKTPDVLPEKLSLFCRDGSMAAASHKDGFLQNNRKALYTRAAETKKAYEIWELEGREIFVEILGRPNQAVILGGGHVSMPVISLAKRLGFFVTVIEDRKEFAERVKLAGADQAIYAPFDQGLSQVEDGAHTYFVIVTRGHEYDRLCLEQILTKTYAYVGMMGSKSRTAKLLALLEKEGFDKVKLGEVHTPIGLPIGAETPEEIAVSILAEMIEVKNHIGGFDFFSKEIQKGLGILEARVSAVIIRKEGSAPRSAGSRMVIGANGQVYGTVGGGVFEKQILEAAGEMLSRKESTGMRQSRKSIVMTDEQAGAEGMVCGGRMEVLLEYLPERSGE